MNNKAYTFYCLNTKFLLKMYFWLKHEVLYNYQNIPISLFGVFYCMVDSSFASSVLLILNLTVCKFSLNQACLSEASETGWTPVTADD